MSYMNKVNNNETLAKFFPDGTILSSHEKYNATMIAFRKNSKGFVSWKVKNKIGNLSLKLPIVRK